MYSLLFLQYFLLNICIINILFIIKFIYYIYTFYLYLYLFLYTFIIHYIYKY